VETRIFYGIIILFFISTATAFAQEELSVQTDDNRYDEGDTIVISGNVGIMIGETPVLIQIIHKGAIIEIAQITVAQDGSFTKTVQDGIFMVLVDGEEWDDVEIVNNKVTVMFPAGTELIEIIGTFVIPEFGTIAAMILAIAIISIIAISAKSRLSIIPRY